MTEVAPEEQELVEIDEPFEETVTFTVDSALLRELGERLVGRPHIALAELIKNSYDADATHVEVKFAPEKDIIVVIDNGHGMTEREFKDFWMRVGSPHKEEKRFSRELGRRMTGNKGVGRLSAQFLAHEITISTVSNLDESTRLVAEVDWDEAVEAGELTEARARYRLENNEDDFPAGKPHGTSIVLKGLKQDWDAEQTEDLAREIWSLQPPFGSFSAASDKQRFEVEFESPDPEATERFKEQMQAYQKIWYAKIKGRLLTPEDTGEQNAVVKYHLEFDDGDEYEYEREVEDCKLSHLRFEIRTYYLKYRQPYGISVEEAREYFNDYGGVHVYDSGFHLPYYGPDNDWLDVEMEHSHRRSKSDLLPEDLQVQGGQEYVPTNSRLYGAVHVNTAKELEEAEESELEKGEYLKIQVSRDRLVPNDAYNQLSDIVRAGIDFYAHREKQRRLEETLRETPVETASEKFERVDEVLEHFEQDIPEEVYDTLESEIEEAIEASEQEEETIEQRTGLLGSLATAGMSAMAYEHEVQKQYDRLKQASRKIKTIETKDPTIREQLNSVASEIDEWIERAQSLRNLFSPLLDEENREVEARFRAKSTIREVCNQMDVLLGKAEVDLEDVDPDFRLPAAQYPEWNAIFQNVLVNAANAMLDSDRQLISVISETDGRERFLRIRDTGSGVDLEKSEELFKPFERQVSISESRRELGAGGSGLGLAIVRMIANNVGCDVRFVEPAEGFSTSFEIHWTEQDE